MFETFNKRNYIKGILLLNILFLTLYLYMPNSILIAKTNNHKSIKNEEKNKINKNNKNNKNNQINKINKLTKQIIICKKKINNMTYTILKDDNINYIAFKVPNESGENQNKAKGKNKDKSKLEAKVTPFILKTIQIPKDYYVYKIMNYDIDKDSNKELLVALKTGSKDKNIKLYAYRFIKNQIQYLPFNYKGRHIKYPYYKEDIIFNNNNITIKYLNKNIDISNANFQLVYTEKFILDKSQFKLKDQEYYCINSKSLGDRPNLLNNKNIALLSNRSGRNIKSSIENYMHIVAKKYRIPFVILKSVAVCESNIRQFSGDSPLISFDGGIGIMQITPLNRISNINRIAYDPLYNLEVGAQELCAKWNYKYKNIIPKTDNDNRNILENWYFAVWAYNGWCEANNPNMIPYRTRYGIRRYAYQEKIIDLCQKYYGTTLSRFNYKKVFPKKGMPYANVVYKTPFPYHYGDIGRTVVEKDVRPEVTGLKYNKANNSITWKFNDKDYGDYQKSYCVTITNSKRQVVLNTQIINKNNTHKITNVLKPDSYEVSLKVKDRYYLLSNPVKIKFTVLGNKISDKKTNKIEDNKLSDKKVNKTENNLENKELNTTQNNQVNQPSNEVNENKDIPDNQYIENSKKQDKESTTVNEEVQ